MTPRWRRCRCWILLCASLNGCSYWNVPWPEKRRWMAYCLFGIVGEEQHRFDPWLLKHEPLCCAITKNTSNSTKGLAGEMQQWWIIQPFCCKKERPWFSLMNSIAWLTFLTCHIFLRIALDQCWRTFPLGHRATTGRARIRLQRNQRHRADRLLFFVSLFLCLLACFFVSLFDYSCVCLFARLSDSPTNRLLVQYTKGKYNPIVWNVWLLVSLVLAHVICCLLKSSSPASLLIHQSTSPVIIGFFIGASCYPFWAVPLVSRIFWSTADHSIFGWHSVRLILRSDVDCAFGSGIYSGLILSHSVCFIVGCCLRYLCCCSRVWKILYQQYNTSHHCQIDIAFESACSLLSETIRGIFDLELELKTLQKEMSDSSLLAHNIIIIITIIAYKGTAFHEISSVIALSALSWSVRRKKWTYDKRNNNEWRTLDFNIFVVKGGTTTTQDKKS